MEENPGMAHKIVLNNRDQGNLTGILDVISFDENTIVLDTDMGLLTIKGKDLHVNRLSLEKGEIDIEGRTDSLVYSAGGGTKSGGSFGRNCLNNSNDSAGLQTYCADRNKTWGGRQKSHRRSRFGMDF